MKNLITDFINQEISAERERSITRLLQNYDPCQYGTPSLNISPEQFSNFLCSISQVHKRLYFNQKIGTKLLFIPVV